jgi:hypothetical protein
MRVRLGPVERLWANVDRGEGCWLRPSPLTQSGYSVLTVDGRQVRAHRFAWEVSNGRPVPEGLCVLHRCDVRNCIRPDHLWLGTDADNNADMWAKNRGPSGERNGNAKHPEIRWIRARGDEHGLRKHPERAAKGDAHGSRKHPERLARGEQNHNAKLTADLVREIRERRSSEGLSYRRLGEIFGIQAMTAYAVVNRDAWKHVS